MSIRIMNLVWEMHCPSHTAKLVLLAIANHANDDGRAWPSLARLAAKCDLSRRSVIDQIVILETGGYLSAERSPGKSTVYRLATSEAGSPLPVNGVHHPATATSEAGSPVNHITSESGSPPPVNVVHPTRERGSLSLVNVVHQPVNVVHPNHQEPSVEPSEDRTLGDSGETGSPVNRVHGSALPALALDQIARILRTYPNSRGRSDAEREIAETIRLGGATLDEIEAGTAAIAAVIASDYTEADRLRFVVAANRFFGERRWAENPADWRLAKAVTRETATTGKGTGGEWAGRVAETSVTEPHIPTPCN
jgi:hypothetical protein